ncbi:DUF6507 family protein [Streptomyces oceani]|uniref:Uncharacterized protein n=1 Tax=Streptomyces oceani TaxID=1075402 RepID=A0A1E7KHJ5_9ACTN|nr:DUF6507 family protein [Streptomyces oceani]OEV03420.1 hypothetical protein AN216_11110 [Streptomyces oceani]
MKWDLKPTDINGVLTSTAEVAKGFEKQVKSYGGNLKSAASSAGTLDMGEGKAPEAGLVGLALSQFAENTETDLRFIAARAGKSIEGAGKATEAYLNGDLAMAAEAQSEAQKKPDLDMPGEGQGGGK